MINPSIALDVHPIQGPNVMEAYGNALALQSHMQQQQLQQKQMQAIDLENQLRERNLNAANGFSALVAANTNFPTPQASAAATPPPAAAPTTTAPANTPPNPDNALAGNGSGPNAEDSFGGGPSRDNALAPIPNATAGAAAPTPIPNSGAAPTSIPNIPNAGAAPTTRQIPGQAAGQPTTPAQPGFSINRDAVMRQAAANGWMPEFYKWDSDFRAAHTAELGNEKTTLENAKAKIERLGSIMTAIQGQDTDAKKANAYDIAYNQLLSSGEIKPGQIPPTYDAATVDMYSKQAVDAKTQIENHLQENRLHQEGLNTSAKNTTDWMHLIGQATDDASLGRLRDTFKTAGATPAQLALIPPTYSEDGMKTLRDTGQTDEDAAKGDATLRAAGAPLIANVTTYGDLRKKLATMAPPVRKALLQATPDFSAHQDSDPISAADQATLGNVGLNSEQLRQASDAKIREANASRLAAATEERNNLMALRITDRENHQTADQRKAAIDAGQNKVWQDVVAVEKGLGNNSPTPADAIKYLNDPSRWADSDEVNPYRAALTDRFRNANTKDLNATAKQAGIDAKNAPKLFTEVMPYMKAHPGMSQADATAAIIAGRKSGAAKTAAPAPANKPAAPAVAQATEAQLRQDAVRRGLAADSPQADAAVKAARDQGLIQ